MEPQQRQGTKGNTPSPKDTQAGTPDPEATAGKPNSVGAQSIRDGRPATCDDVVEAMDEAGPGPK
jgi:hypothetical protein